MDLTENWRTSCVKALMLENHQILNIFKHEGGYFCKELGDEV
jgi:hypothetical protein